MALCILCIFLVPFALPGLALINTGLGRSRSSAHSMMASLCMFAVAALTYFVCGFSWQGFIGLPAHSFSVGGKAWSLIAAEPFFMRGLDFNGSSASLAAWLQILCVGLAALIPLGAGSDRWRLSASCASTALLAGWTYPLFAHWVWGGGWLQQLGASYGLGRGFMDSGGAGTIQALGGLTALPVVWILGARKGKYNPAGMPNATPGHNAAYVLFGCVLALAGWFGLNAAGALLFGGSHSVQPALIAIDTLLSACGGILSGAFVTRVRFGKPDASLCANGWVSGLVASSAGCALMA